MVLINTLLHEISSNIAWNKGSRGKYDLVVDVSFTFPCDNIFLAKRAFAHQMSCGSAKVTGEWSAVPRRSLATIFCRRAILSQCFDEGIGESFEDCRHI